MRFPWFGLFLSLLFAGCAAPKTPTGGPKDESPPGIVQEASTASLRTHFTDKTITITFDEWITLKDIYNQLVVSPLMPKEPDVKQKGKSIVITLPDSLAEETTYTLYFGNAIADLNEGNILENFSFVFSTGAKLDSLRLSGTVTDATTLQPAAGIWVMLYPAGLDSAVYKRKPEYLAKTNKEGAWSIANMRADTFDLVALKDDNLNFLYDLESEQFGWLDDPIHTSDSLTSLPEIRVFPKEKRNLVKEVLHTSPGWLRLVIEAAFPGPVPEFLPPVENTATLWNGDTLHVWYSPETSYAGQVIVNDDTTRIRAATTSPLAGERITVSVVTGRLHPSDSAAFVTQLPVAGSDISRIILQHDSLGNIPFHITPDTSISRKFWLKGAWKENVKYNLTFLPGAVTDFWGRSNDTIRHTITVNSAEQFGEMTLNISGLDSSVQYIAMIKLGDQALARFVVYGKEIVQLRKPAIPPGKYTVEIIEDLNRNGHWDTGDYAARRQPERKKLFTPDNLRAGWEMDVNIVW